MVGSSADDSGSIPRATINPAQPRASAHIASDGSGEVAAPPTIKLNANNAGTHTPAITRRLVERFVRQPPPGSGVPETMAQLTERELEVLRLVARGLSNGEIAIRLFISQETVKTHVSHILKKLGLQDRVQAVVAAYESGLVQAGS
jgi:DNA-binding NarL/FixJ family response regulator